ncbi:transposase, partial [Shigella flexneri]
STLKSPSYTKSVSWQHYQHSLKFTYWYHQRNWIIYRLNGIKKYWRYCRQ